MSSPEDELAELRAAYEEFKESSAAIEEDLEQEVSKLEKENARSAHKLLLAEQAMENANRKAEQARELANRQVLTLEKQIQALESSMKVMVEERRRMEQEKDDVERLHRQLQAQTEDQYEAFEDLVEKEAMLRTGMEDLELKFHRTTLEHMSLLTRLKAAFKILYAQLKRAKQVPAAQMPEASPEEQASMDADTGSSPAPDPSRASFQNEEAVLTELKALKEDLATSRAQLDQAQRKVKELECELQRERKFSVLPDDSPRSVSVGGAPVEVAAGEEKATAKTISEGYLYKRGDGALSTWKRQLYKINSESHALEFFFLQSSKVTTKRIKLGDILLSGAQISVAQKDDKPNVFSIQPRFSKKTFYLQAPNSADRDTWMASLQLETLSAIKRIAGSVRQDWVEVSYDQTNFTPMYCVVSKSELQFFWAEDDDKPSKRYELGETVEIQRLPKIASQRPALSLKFGAAVGVEHFYIEFNSIERRDTWLAVVNELCHPQNEREDSEQNNVEEVEGAEFSFCGQLSLNDPNTKQWDQFWFQLSADTNFLDYYPDQKSALANETPLGRFALIGSVQAVTSTAIVSNYHAGAYIEHEHIFGLTPPFTSHTRLIQCTSEENLFQWMDGLVTLLDSKVARDPYSTKEGYLYKQGVKATSKWRKKYVVLGLPDLKYYKAGRHTRAVILTLTPESQIILRHPVKKFVYTFTVQESPGSREFLWGSKSQAEGEAWVSAIQACVTKLRLRQTNPTTFNIPKLLGARNREPSRDTSNRNGREFSPNLRREASPSPAFHTVGEWGQPKLVARRAIRKFTNPEEPQPRASSSSPTVEDAEATREQSLKAAAYAYAVSQQQRKITATNSPPSHTNNNTNDQGSDSNPTTPTEATQKLTVTAPTSTPVNTTTFNFIPRESTNAPSLPHSPSFAALSVQPISTAKRGALHVLKTSLFSRNERWAPMTFELQANDRVLYYYEQNSAKPVQCAVAGCTNEPFARFDGFCAHHRSKGRLNGGDSPRAQNKRKPCIWNLVGAQIDAHVTNQYPGHEFTFGLTGTGGPALVIAAQDEKERAEWLVLLRARIYARFMFQSSSYEGLMGQLMPGGEWKEKYYVVRLGCLECYNRTDHKRAWSHAMTRTTKVRTEDLTVATGKGPASIARSMSSVGRNTTLRSSASFLKGNTRSNASHLVDFLAASNAQTEGKTVCENNNDRLIHPKGVFVVDLGSEKLILAAESPAERDLWIAALDACVKEARADADDDDVPSVEDEDVAANASRRSQSLGGPGVQISVQNSPPSDELPSHLSWWANRGPKVSTAGSSVAGSSVAGSSVSPPVPSASPAIPIPTRSAPPPPVANTFPVLTLSRTPPSKNAPPPPRLSSKSFNDLPSR